jgi:periplasmic protein TonB
MSNLAMYDELDRAVDRMLAAPESNLAGSGADVEELVELAAELRHLPRANFQSRLRLELEWEAAGRAVSAVAGDGLRAAVQPAASSQTLPSFSGKRWVGYPVRRINFALSLALHVVMAALVGAGFYMVKSASPVLDSRPFVTVRLDPYPMPVGSRESHGGGSGGAAERIKASMGVAPRASREQLTPPIVVENNLRPRLMAERTVIAPPELDFPRTRQLGDPLSALTALSNGPGLGNGIGGSTGGGVGDKGGDGRGPGSGGGCCGGTYTWGNGVSMPRAIYSPEPEFSDEARKSKYQGEVILTAVIGADGRPRNLAVVRSLGMGLDEKALETVHTWRFEPGKMDGRPVAVRMNIIINFHLF